MSLVTLSKVPHKHFLTTHPASADTPCYQLCVSEGNMTGNLRYSPSTLHKDDLMWKDATSFVEDISMCLCAGTALWRPAAAGSCSTCCTLKTIRWTFLHFHPLCPSISTSPWVALRWRTGPPRGGWGQLKGCAPAGARPTPGTSSLEQSSCAAMCPCTSLGQACTAKGI